MSITVLSPHGYVQTWGGGGVNARMHAAYSVQTESDNGKDHEQATGR